MNHGNLAITTDETPRTQKPPAGTFVGAGIAIGVALGAALNNIGLGIALGTAFGAAMDAASYKRHKDRSK